MNNYGYENQGYSFYNSDDWSYFTLDDEKRARSRFSKIFLAIFVFSIVSSAVALLTEAATILIFGKEGAANIFSSWWYIWLLNVLSLYVIAFPIFWLIIRKMRKVDRISGSIKISDFLIMFLITQLFTYVGNLVATVFGNMVSLVLGDVPENTVSDMVLTSPLWVVILISVIIGPIVEELMFRKLMIDRMSIYGDRLAIIVSAITFGIFHGNFYQLFYSTLIGFILGYIYVRTGNILYSIAMHVLFNFWGTFLPWILKDSVDRYYELMEIIAVQGESAVDAAEYLRLTLIVGGYSLLQLGLSIAGLVFLIKRHKRTFISDRCEVSIPKAKRTSVILKNTGAVLLIISSVFTMIFNIIAPLITAASTGV